MFVFTSITSYSRWKVCLLFHVMVLLHNPALCQDSSPEKASIGAEAIMQLKREEGRKSVDQEIRSTATEKLKANEPPFRQIETPFQQIETPSVMSQEENRHVLPEEAMAYDLLNQELRNPAVIRADQDVCNENPRCDATTKYRTMDGTCNNLRHPDWGSAGSCFRPMLGPVYKEICGKPPPARYVSVHAHSGEDNPSKTWTQLLMLFGQFLAHDITFTQSSTTENGSTPQCCPKSSDTDPQCYPISTLPDDPFYSRFNVSCLEFVRSAPCNCPVGNKNPVNGQTFWIDASMIYGTNENQSRSLRSPNRTGELLVQETPYGDLLPADDSDGSVSCANASQGTVRFVAGDGRANQHLQLTAIMHTTCLRMHNYFARELLKINPWWNDEKTYQEARRMIIASLQRIVYNEYLPEILGKKYMDEHKLSPRSATRYDESIYAPFPIEFSTCFFRFSHTMISRPVNRDPKTTVEGGKRLADTFVGGRNHELCDGALLSLVGGILKTPMKAYDRHMISDVTNFLYRNLTAPTGRDLASADLQRGRDHGLAPYVTYVGVLLRHKIREFGDLLKYGLMKKTVVELLKQLYKCVEEIDAFTGCLCEEPKNGAMVGPSMALVIARAFHHLMYGDRHFYSHEGVFTPEQVTEIEKISLAHILCWTTNITQLQKYVMRLPGVAKNPIVQCKNLPKIDFSKWNDTEQ